MITASAGLQHAEHGDRCWKSKTGTKSGENYNF